MAKKEENNTTQPTFGEIGTIRDILMGQQMTEYNGRFSELENRINTVEADLTKKLDALEVKMQDRIAEMQDEFSNRLAALEQHLSGTAADLEHKIEKVSTADKVSLGKMLAKVSKQLIGE